MSSPAAHLHPDVDFRGPWPGPACGAGDALVSPAGLTGTWEVREAARKHYVIYE